MRFSPAARRITLLIAVLPFVAISLFLALRHGSNAPARFTASESAVDSASTITSASLSAVDAPVTSSTSSSAAWFLGAGAPLRLSGRVFLDGHPLAGATVVVTDELTTAGLLPAQSALSDRDGRFAFPALPRIRAWVRLVAQHGGAAPAWAVVPGDMAKDDIELRLETCKMHVYGVVSDASGGAVTGAKVSFEKVPEHFALADAHGSFSICAATRSLRLRVDAPGYGTWLKWISPRGALRQDVTLVPAAGVTGTVVFTRGGAIVPYAFVSVRLAGESIRDVQADAEGHFDVEGISPGSYVIEARAAGARSKQPVDVAVFASAKASVTVPVDTRARVHGRVVAAGGPVAKNGVNLGFSGTFEWGTSVRTLEDGSFTIDDAPIGNVLVKVDDYEVESPKTLLVPEEGLADVTLHAAPKAQLLVTVTRAGAPVSDATVYARGFTASESRITNAAGIATFKGLGEPSYRLVTEHENDFAVLERVQVSRDSPTNVSLELTAGRQVAGHVVDESGAPVDGARVAFSTVGTTEDGGASAITGADGSFRGGPLRGPALYQVKITRSGFALDPKSELPRLTVAASGPVVPEDLVLVVKTQDKELAGRVVDGAGGPVQDARITVSRPERHADVLAVTFSGNDGAFTFHGLGVGPWAVKAAAPSGSEVEVKPVTLPSRDLRLELPPVGSIRGTLKGFSRTPSIMAWSIVGYDWDFNPAVVESNGFTISGLSKGRYHIAASSTDAAAQTTVDIDGNGVALVELAASGKRTIHGKTLDFATGHPLPNMSCQAAPYIAGARSPVVVPGNIFSNDEGAFDLVDVPASDLYMWCISDATFRGGVARMPSDLGDKPITVWGLDVRGRPPLDTRALGLTLADDEPFSRRIAVIEPKGAAERAGLRVGDVIESVGDKPVTEVGNGIVRNYLALLLMSQRAVPVVASRAGSVVPINFALK